MCAQHHHSHDQHLQQDDSPDEHPAQAVPSSSSTHSRDNTQSPAPATISRDHACRLDPDDPDTRRAAGSFGFTPADLLQLAQLARPGRPLVAEYHGWTESGILAILHSLPPSPERRFLATLFAIITGCSPDLTKPQTEPHQPQR